MWISGLAALAGRFSFGGIMTRGEPSYVEDSITEFWKRSGVTPIPMIPCKDGEEGFDWSEFINELGRRTQEKGHSTSS
jgi:hypothetical protein